MKRIIILAVASLVVLIGCNVGPSVKNQTVAIPGKYATSGDTIARNDTMANLKWFDLFKDPKLQELIRIGLEENKDLKISMSRILEKYSYYSYTAADMYPWLDYGVQGGYYKPSENNPNETGGSDNRATYSLYGGLSWEIDLWGKYRSANRSADAQINASIAEQRAATVLLVSEIAKTYFQILDYDNRLAVSERTLASRQEGLALQTAKFEKGEISLLEKNQAEIQEAIAAAAVPNYRRKVAQAENAMQILLGRPPGKIGRGSNIFEQTLVPEIPIGVPSELLFQRPDLVRSYELYISSIEDVGVASAMLYPSLNLNAVAGFSSGEFGTVFTPESFFANAIGGLIGPIFQWSKNTERVNVLTEKSNQSLLLFEKSLIVALGEVEDALIAIQTFQEEYKAYSRQVVAAEQALELSKARYNEGMTSYLEVIDSERALFEAEQQASQALQLQLNSVVQLYKSLGGGWK
jgi:multidrug efflux system outer membrane protein